MTDITPYDQDTDDSFDEASSAGPAGVGDLVEVRWLDTLTGDDVVRHGIVVEVVDDATAVRVGWFHDVSGPIPLDHQAHERVDAPRVARIGVAVDELLAAVTILAS